MFKWRFGPDPMWGEFTRLQKGMDDLFSVLRESRSPAMTYPWSQARLFPLLNVHESPDSFVVTAEIPGMKTDDLEIRIEGDTLTLKGERKPLESVEGASYHRRERATGIFQRSLTLPASVDSEKVKATYKEGVLTVKLTKSATALPRQISISEE
jgi:HSP20 family protein